MVNDRKKRRTVKSTIDINEIPTDSTLVACPLCHDGNTSRYAIQFSKLFLSCPTCQLVFLHPRHHLTEEEEKKRYEEHNNSPYDQRYRSFLAPVLDELTPLLGTNYTLHGLDYGCGPGPTLSSMFREKGFKMADYDPFFKPVAFVDELQTPQPGGSTTPPNTTHTSNTTNSTETNNSTNETTDNINTIITDTINNTNTINNTINNTNTSSNTNMVNTLSTTNTTTTNAAKEANETKDTTSTKPEDSKSSEISKISKISNENNDKNSNTQKLNTKLIPPYDKDPFNPADDYFAPPFDFITCTETAEHFRHPAEDFQKLLSPQLLHPNKGILAIMTQMLYSKEQFVNWWYLRDKTHVSFYTISTMEYIAKSNNLQLILPATKNIAIFIRNETTNGQKENNQ